MKLAFNRVRDALRDSFWFLPLGMAILAAAGALASVAFDHAIGDQWVRQIAWVWSGGPDGARSVLSTVAGSLMTVISIVFSLTITTLAQTSSHFGPRVLRNFTSNRGVQFTLGTFIATFVFCLLVLRTVRSVEESPFVPYLSVNLGVLLTLVSLGVLIFFIHHIAQSIQAETLTADVGNAILRGVTDVFPERVSNSGSDATSGVVAPVFEWDNARVVHSTRTGYLQHTDDRQLLRLAVQHDKVIRLRARPGDFLWTGSALIDVLPASPVIPDFEARLSQSFNIGNRRTHAEDPVYAIQQLVEIAAHALSPGTNEPFTALNALDWLGAALAKVADRDFPAERCDDEQGNPRVFTRPLAFQDLANAAFDPIRTFGASNADVLLHLLDIITRLVPLLVRVDDLTTLTEHAKKIATDSVHILNASDRRRVLDRHRASDEVFAAAYTALER